MEQKPEHAPVTLDPPTHGLPTGGGVYEVVDGALQQTEGLSPQPTDNQGGHHEEQA